MQFFLDTAHLGEIKKYAQWGMVDGVTTNPTLIAQEGVSLEKRIKEIAEIIEGPLSAEVISTEAKEMVKEGRIYASWHRNVYVKIPITSEGLKALNILSEEGINTNVTLCFSLPQAIMAAKAGATLVSPFIGRLDDISSDGMELISQIVQAFDNYEFQTKVLVASIRHPQHIVESALIGADIATMPPAVMEQLIHHPLTEIGLEKFLKDWETVKKKQK